jgi:hypothetical protein
MWTHTPLREAKSDRTTPLQYILAVHPSKQQRMYPRTVVPMPTSTSSSLSASSAITAPSSSERSSSVPPPAISESAFSRLEFSMASRNSPIWSSSSSPSPPSTFCASSLRFVANTTHAQQPRSSAGQRCCAHCGRLLCGSDVLFLCPSMLAIVSCVTRSKQPKMLQPTVHAPPEASPPNKDVRWCGKGVAFSVLAGSSHGGVLFLFTSGPLPFTYGPGSSLASYHGTRLRTRVGASHTVVPLDWLLKPFFFF